MAVGTTFFMGNEDIDYTFIGSTITVSLDNQTFRPAWSRCSIQVFAGSTTDPPSPRMVQNAPWAIGPQSAAWMLRYFAWSALGGQADNNATLFRLLDTNGIARMMVRGAGSNAVKISIRDAGGAFTDLVTSAANALPTGGLSPIPMNFHYDFNAVVTSGARTDISIAAGPPGVISTVTGDFVADGFTPGGTITITGGTNAGTYVLATVTSLSMTTASTLINEAAGASITITSTGTVKLWFNDNPVAYFAGGISTDGVTALQQADWASCNMSNGIFWSEDLIGDTININAGVFTLPPLAPGVTQQWAGVVADINKIVILDTTFIADGTPGDLSGWTTPVAFPVGAWAIQSIGQSARAAIGTTGPTHFDWYLRVGGTDNLGGTNNAPTLFFSNFSNFLWEMNPTTSSPWAITDVTGGTLNLGVKSLA